jgi:copper chaperone NosL
MIRIRFALIALLAVVGAGCDRAPESAAPAPRELSSNAVAAFCGMDVTEHPGPKAQIFLKGRQDPVWFASVHDMFAYTLLPEEPKAIVAIYVTDMGKARNWDRPEPGNWTEARKAVFVIGSRRLGGMDEKEAVPFGTEAAAKAFIAENGGRLVRFDAVPPDYVLPSGGTEVNG